MELVNQLINQTAPILRQAICCTSRSARPPHMFS